MPFLALDIGTSTIKGAVVEPASGSVRQIRSVPSPPPATGLEPSFCEIDPDRVMAAVREVLSALSALEPECAGLLLCGQMGGLILVDGRGAAHSNYISWKDRRAATCLDVLKERLGEEGQAELGREIQPGQPLSLLFWHSQTGRRFPRDLYACPLLAYVAANLCQAPPAMDATNANGAVHLETRTWHTGALDRLGLAETRWPALRDFREPVGELRLGRSAIPCYAPVGDHQCALAGAGLREHELSVNVSTGAQVSLLAARHQPGAYQTRPYFDGLYLNTITHLPAGRSLNALVNLISELAAASGRDACNPWPYIEREAARVEHCDLGVGLSFFPGPAGDRGTISGIREDNLTVGQLFYAAFRSMAGNFRDCAARLRAASSWTSAVLSGGLVRKSDLLRRMIAAELGTECRLSAGAEETLEGLLALALVIEGRAATVDAANALRCSAAGGPA